MVPQPPGGRPRRGLYVDYPLQNGTELPVTLADARAAIELITAIYHAGRTRQVVSLPIADDHPLYGGWQP